VEDSWKLIIFVVEYLCVSEESVNQSIQSKFEVGSWHIGS
jgi:hypothetical protein